MHVLSLSMSGASSRDGPALTGGSSNIPVLTSVITVFSAIIHEIGLESVDVLLIYLFGLFVIYKQLKSDLSLQLTARCTTKSPYCAAVLEQNDGKRSDCQVFIGCIRGLVSLWKCRKQRETHELEGRFLF